MKLFKLLKAILFVLPLLAPFVSQGEVFNFTSSIGNGLSDSPFPQNITLDINGVDYSLPDKEIASWLNEKISLRFNADYRSEIENTNLCQYEKSIICNMLLPHAVSIHSQKISHYFINDLAVEKFIKDLARHFNRDPQDAKLKIENGKVSVFTLSQEGIKLDENKSVQEIMDYLAEKKFDEKLKLPFKAIEPEISTDSIGNLGIKSLIGEGSSNFAGSPKNRVYNIKVATNRFNGILIKPKEEFSFVEILGEVDAEHGYLPELVIKKDKTEPEFGGGICQVSTTVFRAAINTGLEITARRNHAYPVAYYNPQGMDATVYVPRPDLRFINDTPGYILVQTKIEGTRLIFDFYGNDDGRKINIIGPKILESNPDGSMKATFTQEVYDKDGNRVREDIFNSNYDSPSKYPHPTSDSTLTKKPKDWSKSQWEEYQKIN